MAHHNASHVWQWLRRTKRLPVALQRAADYTDGSFFAFGSHYVWQRKMGIR